MADIDFKDLRYAIAVADYGSFSAAAGSLGVEVSVLSRRIRDLELKLQVGLFQRHARGARLTSAGTEIIRDCRELIERLGAVRRRAADLGAGLSGELAIGTVCTFARGNVAKLLLRFRAGNPDIALTLSEDGPRALLPRLVNGALDVGITARALGGRASLGEPDDAIVTPLWTERYVAMLPKGDERPSVEWADVAEHDILYREGDAIPPLAGETEGDGAAALRFVPHRCSHEGLRGLVAAGMGWSLVPESHVDHSTPEIGFAPVVSPGAEFQMTALWMPHTDNPALKRFVALAKQLFGPEVSRCP